MGTIKIIKIGLLITVTQFLISGNCKKEDTGCISSATAYSFAVTAEWSPQQEIYNIGDAIMLNSSFSKMLIDQINPSMIIDYSNSVGIGGSFGFYELDTVQHQVKGAVSKFDFFPIVGTIGEGIIVPGEQKVVNYAELQSSYSFNLKIVAKQKGIFLLYVSDCSSRGIRGKNCTKAGFGMTVTNSDKHFGLYQYAMQQPPDEIQKKIMYCFRVQ